MKEIQIPKPAMLVIGDEKIPVTIKDSTIEVEQIEGIDYLKTVGLRRFVVEEIYSD